MKPRHAVSFFFLIRVIFFFSLRILIMLDFQFRFIFFILKLNNTCIKFSYLISKTINRQAEDEQSTEVPRLDFPINLQTEYKSNHSTTIKRRQKAGTASTKNQE